MNWRALTDTVIRACRDTFGEPLIYVPGTGAPYSVQGIFDENTELVDRPGTVPVENYQATVNFLAKDIVLGPVQGDMVTNVRTSKSYRISWVDYDGWAKYTCYLEEY